MATYGPERFTLSGGRAVTIRHLRTADSARYAAAELDPLLLHLGVFDHDQLVGNLAFFPQRADHEWLRHIDRFNMGIQQEFWGQGLGSRLLEIMETHARANAFTRIEAEVRTANEPGVALYRKAGYEIEGIRKRAALIGGEYHDEYFIAKMLDDDSSNWAPPVLETERLILRPVRMGDADSVFSYANNPNVARFVTWDAHQSIEDSKNFLRRAVAGYRKGIPNPFAITLRGHDTMLGTVGCWWSGSVEQGCMEIGYALAEKYWGRGYVPEAGEAVLNYIFSEYPVERIQARCKVENESSARVMEKIGMLYEGTMRRDYFAKGRFWDLKMYSILKDEFQD